MRRHFRSDEENQKRIEEANQRDDISRENEPQSNIQARHDVSEPDPHLFDLEPHIIDELRTRWSTVQAQFVDQPCSSIEQADALVADAIERIHQMLVDQQEMLRDRWYDHEDVSTEDLRVTLQDYRTFLNNLLDH